MAMAVAQAVAKKLLEEARCADGGCRPYGGAPMCAWCYEEKIVKATEKLQALLAQIKRVPRDVSDDAQPPRFLEPGKLISFRRSTRDCS